jgi:hypothetical protein
MSRSLPFLSGLVLICLLNPFPVTGQAGTHAKEPVQSADPHEEQVLQMAHFVESTFNMLGDTSVTMREKDIVINESYLKFFRDDKVQVEDDLDENRQVVTNKNIQAYLKDINFFFRYVTFIFTIEEVSREINDDGQVYYKVSLNRNLQGMTIDGILINNTQVRYMEINLDPDRQDLKIVSIYTTKLSEKEDMANWWSQLPAAWKQFFAGQVNLPDSLPIHQVVLFNDTMAILESDRPEYAFDTLYMGMTPLYQSIRQLWALESVNVNRNQSIRSLEPLKKLTRLISLSVSETSVEDLTPLRSLSKLEVFDCSHTLVHSLEPLHYSLNLKELNIEDTWVEDISIVASFKKLEVLNGSFTTVRLVESLAELSELSELRLSHTLVTQLDPLQKLTQLSVLDLSHTAVTSLTSLADLTALKYLNIGNTQVDDLKPLTGLTSLQFIYMDYTPVDDLDPLLKLPELKRIYCDHSKVTSEEANVFMISRPETLVIYETAELTSWWNSLDDNWKKIFSSAIGLKSEPTTENLHQITLIRKIDVKDDSLIKGLEPLTALINLDELNISNTPVVDLGPLKKSAHLRTLDISGTAVASLEPVRNLRQLEKLYLEGTEITDLEPLEQAENLGLLNIEHTGINSLDPLAGVKDLEIIWADQSGLTPEVVNRFMDGNPGCEIIYMTDMLESWWAGVPPEWKAIFLDALELTDPPGREGLHQVMNLEELTIENNLDISDLEPLKMLSRLRMLQISETRISGLAPLKGASRLEKLICRKSPLSEIASIAALTSLRYLDLSSTHVSDYSLVALLTGLEYINISGTPVRNLKWVKSLPNLSQIDFYNTGISSLSDLEGLPALKTVKCYNTKLNEKKVAKFKYTRPEVDVVFY